MFEMLDEANNHEFFSSRQASFLFHVSFSLAHVYMIVVPICVLRDQPHPVTPCRRVGLPNAISRALFPNLQSAASLDALWSYFSFLDAKFSPSCMVT